jgi:protein NrfD
MSLSTVLFFFLAHLGVGIAFTLVFVSREAGVKFFRFNAGLSAILLVIALAFFFSAVNAPFDVGPGSAGIGVVGIDPLSRLSTVALVACTALMVLYWATVGRVLAKIRPAIVAVAVVTGVIAVMLQALDVSAGGSLTVNALTVASFLTSAAMLGGACTAMILGHWYLVIPSLQVWHLQSIVKVHIASMLARIVVVGAAVWFAIATWQPESGAPNFRHYIMSVEGIFFWQRVLFGLAGPAVLSYLTWETAKIRSTQSATGILYVDFFTVVVGEVLAKYIVLATHVPV